MDFCILVVDDEKLSRQYMRAMIAEFEPEAEILEADSAAAAKTILDNGDVDVLFLDIMMPEVDGFELLKELLHRDFELVFVTAHNQFAIDAIRQGAVDYLLKPIRKSDFKAVLQKVLSRRKQKLEEFDYVHSLEQENKRLHLEKSETESKEEMLLGKLYNGQILTEDDWLAFRRTFEEAHPGFLIRLRGKYPALTQAEIRLVALSRLRLTTKEMAGMLGISPETVRQTRWRLKKKLALDEEQDLADIVNTI